MAFKIGDRVRAIAACDGKSEYIGKTGTIIDRRYFEVRLPITVRWDEPNELESIWNCEVHSLILASSKYKKREPMYFVNPTKTFYSKKELNDWLKTNKSESVRVYEPKKAYRVSLSYRLVKV